MLENSYSIDTTVNYTVFFFTFQMVGVQQYVVKPSTADAAEGFLSAEVLLNNSLTEDLVRKGLPLEVVITQVSAFLMETVAGLVCIQWLALFHSFVSWAVYPIQA